MCNPLKQVSVFEQKRGRKDFKLDEVRFIIGKSKNDGEFIIEGDKTSISLYVKRGKVRGDYQRSLYEYV